MTNRTAPGQLLRRRAPRPLSLCGGRARRGSRASIFALALAVATPASLLVAEQDASAQAWLRDRRYTEGAGIRSGDFELHPGIGAEAGYDSNWFLRTHRDGYSNSNPVGAGVFQLTPSFSITSLGARRREDATGVTQPSPLQFRGSASATFRQFIGDKEIRDQGTIPSGNVSINSDARLDVNAGRPLGFGVFAGYQRLIQPAAVADPNLSFNRSMLRGGGEIIVLPGGGTLDLRGGYQLFANLFEESNGVPFTNLQHEFSVRNRWRFRPRTALFHDTTLRIVNYVNSERSANFLNDGTPLRTRFGVTGLVTERFGTLLAAGYGATFFQDPSLPFSRQYDSIIGQAEGTFYLSQGGGTDEPGKATLLLSTLSLGYLRDFQTSLLGNYYSVDRLYAKVVYAFGGRAIVQLDGYGERQGFPQPFLNAGGAAVPVNVPGTTTPVGDFTNWRAGAVLFGEYRLSDSFGLNATFDYSETFSDTAVTTDVGGGTGTGNGFHLAWRRFQALGGVRWFL